MRGCKIALTLLDRHSRQETLGVGFEDDEDGDAEEEVAAAAGNVDGPANLGSSCCCCCCTGLGATPCGDPSKPRR